MLQFIYRIQPTRTDMLSTGPSEAEAKIVGEHFEYLKALVDKGVVLLAGRTLTENTFGVVVFEAESDAAAKDLMVNDPAVIHGIMHAELWPFRVALWSQKGPID